MGGLRDSCVGFLACPFCGRRMEMGGRSMACPERHSFDLARSGYVNLAAGSRLRRAGDSRVMVAARAAFVEAGHLRPVTESLVATVDAAAPRPSRLVAEVGSGTGHNLAAARRHLGVEDGGGPCAIGIDASKAAADLAARSHPQCLFAVADVEERVPLLEGCADVVLSAFAPRPAAELARVTRPGGVLIVAAAAEGHLAALRRRFDLLTVRPDKLPALRARLEPAFELLSSELVDYPLALSPSDCVAAVMMGPNARHRERPPDLPAESMADRASVLIAAFRRSVPA